MINSRVIFPEITDPFLNQALEELLLKSVSNRSYDIILRFWKAEPSVIIGRHQSIKAEVNLKACRKNNIPIIRRISGGGAVYLDLGCLNFSFFLNNNSRYFTSNVEKLNRFLLRIIINALKELNFDCYLEPPNSILIDGKKISGNAQTFRGNSVLHHGTLLIQTDLKLLEELLTPVKYNLEERYIPSNRAETINLTKINENITTESIIHCIYEQAEKHFHLKLLEMSIKNKELNEAKILMKRKYVNPKWAKY